MANDNCEYLFQPGQTCHRFGNTIHFNSYSQRSEQPDSTKNIILGLGDSVINGGVLTDDSELATTIIGKETPYQMLNISAGSWGPDNCAAYLKEYGTFHAKMMFLVVGSHDIYDNMNFQPVIDIHPSYRSRQYKSAIVELFDRYLIPRYFPTKKKDPDQKAVDGVGIRKDGDVFNPGFAQLKALAEHLDIPFVIYLHPDMQEMKDGRYSEEGEILIAWAKENQVPLYKGLEEGESLDTFRDGIHVNAAGQRVMATCMKRAIATHLEERQ